MHEYTMYIANLSSLHVEITAQLKVQSGTNSPLSNLLAVITLV